MSSNQNINVSDEIENKFNSILNNIKEYFKDIKNEINEINKKTKTIQNLIKCYQNQKIQLRLMINIMKIKVKR